MKNTRALAAVTGSAVLVGVVALATAAIADDDTSARGSERQSSSAEPAGGTGRHDPTVAIDIPAPTEASAAGPIEWVFEDGELSVIVDDELREIPDDITDALDEAIRNDAADRGDDGQRVDVAEWLAEHPAIADVVADLAVIGDGDNRVDVSDWLAEHPSVSDAEWWDFERSVLRALLEG